ncbi:MAG TPA: hypothetical protein VFF70_09735 [Anaerolineae bacterium]|nr:hypothetical protein [Anaerolineae bacterium]
MSIDQIGLILGAALSVIILSYLIGDNFLYRFFTHVLVGVGAAYIVVTVVTDVLIPQMVDPLLQRAQSGQVVVAAAGLLGCILLLVKAWRPRLAGIGNISIGYLVGVGAAVALGGALFGTLSAQIGAAGQLPPRSDPDFWPKVFFIAIAAFGTITTLLSFGFYRVARDGLLSRVSTIGRFFLSAALGATFALVYVASVSLLIDRVQAIADVVNMLSKLPKP